MDLLAGYLKDDIVVRHAQNGKLVTKFHVEDMCHKVITCLATGFHATNLVNYHSHNKGQYISLYGSFRRVMGIFKNGRKAPIDLFNVKQCINKHF